MSLLKTLGFVTGHPLNRDRRLAALGRFLRWQLGSRLVTGPVVHHWIEGARFLVGPGETGLTGNLYAGLHEFPEMAFVLHLLRPGDLFLDIGANAGAYTLLACAVAGARALAFEPVPATFQRLRTNVRLNDLDDRARCLNVALGAAEGRVAFTSGLDTTNHALAEVEVATDATEVALRRLDDILDREAPLLIKLDVEGFESPVLQGAAKTLERPELRAVIMELNGSGARYGYRDADLLETMGDLGFRAYGYDPFTRRLQDLEGGGGDSGNTLFLRDEGLVRRRLEGARRYRVQGHSL